MKNVETSQWALALKTASEELKNKVLNNHVRNAGAETLRERKWAYPWRGQAFRPSRPSSRKSSTSSAASKAKAKSKSTPAAKERKKMVQ